MPSVAQEEPILTASKKRQRDDTDIGIETQLAQLRSSTSLRTLLRGHDGTGSETSYVELRRILPVSKRVRVEPEHHHMQTHTDQNSHSSSLPSPPRETETRPQITRGPSAAQLRPCHICHRRPTKKVELNEFVDCEGCGQRTCYVCVRACWGWQQPDAAYLQSDPDRTSNSFTMEDADLDGTVKASEETHHDEEKPTWTNGGVGHRHKICSRCCVERGRDGDTCCLGCLPFVEG